MAENLSPLTDAPVPVEQNKLDPSIANALLADWKQDTRDNAGRVHLDDLGRSLLPTMSVHGLDNGSVEIFDGQGQVANIITADGKIESFNYKALNKPSDMFVNGEHQATDKPIGGSDHVMIDATTGTVTIGKSVQDDFRIDPNNPIFTGIGTPDTPTGVTDIARTYGSDGSVVNSSNHTTRPMFAGDLFRDTVYGQPPIADNPRDTVPDTGLLTNAGGGGA